AAARGGKDLPQRRHQGASAIDEVDAIVADRIDEAAMKVLAGRPQFQHVAEDRDASTAWPERRLAQHSERGTHRRRIGVIAFVDYNSSTARQLKPNPLAPA